MIYAIKRLLNGVETVIKAVKPTGSQSKKAMGESVVDMAFSLPVYVDFKIGDYVDVYGERYKINLTPSVKKLAQRKYEYQIQFEHLFYDLAKVQLQFLNPQNQLLEPVFSLMGNAATIVGLVVQNANRHSSGWTVGVVDDTDYQNFSFNAENCLQVLNRLASEFGTEFWIDNKTIHLQKREQASGLQFEYGKGKGLYSIARTNKSSINILTRLYVRGGSRNLPLNYRNYSGNLLLPNGATYIQDDAKVNAQTGYGLIEATQVFDTIFPQREGVVSAVVAGDGNWDKFSDSSLDFDVNSYKSAMPAKVAFNTGQLAGYEFEISNYNHTTKQFTINQNTDEALTVPSNLIRPAIGDKYVLLDIYMPQSYVDAAEAKLLAAAQAYYAKNSDPALNFAYSVDCDPIWFAAQNINVVLGNTVNIYDADLGINGEIRIAGYKRDLQTTSKYELEISDSIGVNEIVRQYAQQQRTLQLIESNGLLDVNQIRKNIFLNRLSEQNGYLMLSGEKVKAGIADYALDAAHAAVADYALDADKWDGQQFADYLNQPVRTSDDVRHKSISSPTFVSGFSGNGWKIDEQGNATFDNLTVRKQFNVFELVLNKINATNGALAVTDAVKITSVSLDGNNDYYCQIESDNGTIAVPFAVNDLLRCQVFNGQSTKYYLAKVIWVGPTGFTLQAATKVGAGIPAAGDVVVRFGNTTNLNRQGLLYLTANDSNAPYLDVLDGVNSADLAGKTKVRLGKLDGLTDAELGQLDGYGLYAERAFIKGKVIVTGGNAQTIAGSQALANAAQNNAVVLAAADAQAKANAAQAAAQAMVDAIKVGGRNLLYKSAFENGEDLFDGFNYTSQILSSYGDITAKQGNYFHLSTTIDTTNYSVHYFSTKPVNVQANNQYTFSFNWIIGYSYNHLNLQVVFNDGVNDSFNQYTFPTQANHNWGDRSIITFTVPANAKTVRFRFDAYTLVWFALDALKLEEGNKATTWTPAPEDVQGAIDTAQNTANAAQTAYNNLTASLKSLAYQDVVELAKLGSTVVEGGYIKTSLIDANYIKANVINAGYINTLQLDASAIKTGTIDSARINAQQILVNANGATQTDLANVKVGGRNYIISKGFNSYTPNNTLWVYNSVVNEFSTVINWPDSLTYRYDNFSPMKAGTYTASGIIKRNGLTVSNTAFYDKRFHKSHTLGSFNYDETTGRFEFTQYIQDQLFFIDMVVPSGTVVGDVFTIKEFKFEKGNKATDWTPAPEDVQNAIDLAKSTADAAQTAHNNLTASLKSLAYQDVVELAKLGSTIIQGGYIKASLIDADYIKTNIVNAAYVNALGIVTKNLKTADSGKRVEIDAINNNIRIVDYNGDDIITIDDDSALERVVYDNLTTPPQTYYYYGPGVRVGAAIGKSGNLSRNGLTVWGPDGKLKFKIGDRTGAGDYRIIATGIEPDSMSADYGTDITFTALNGVFDLRKADGGTVKVTFIDGLLMRIGNPTNLIYWNDAQTAYATFGPCGSGYVGSQHQYTVPANTYSSTVSKAMANSQALTAAQNGAQAEANNYGYCSYIGGGGEENYV